MRSYLLVSTCMCLWFRVYIKVGLEGRNKVLASPQNLHTDSHVNARINLHVDMLHVCTCALQALSHTQGDTH